MLEETTAAIPHETLEEAAGTPADFSGRHFVASYCECDAAALNNMPAFLVAFRAAARAAGATVLSSIEHEFPGGGFTALLLLGESHASLHTYPEHAACFVDLFTCGFGCRAEAFDDVLRSYLRPGRSSCQVFVRADARVSPMENWRIK